jgi:hypothetical protein
VHGDRQHQSQRADVVHEGGEYADRDHHHGERGQVPHRDGLDGTSEKPGYPGGLHRVTDDEHRGDGDDRGVAEAGEHVCGIDQSRKGHYDQRPDGNNVITPTAPGEKHKGRAENATDENLVGIQWMNSAGIWRWWLGSFLFLEFRGSVTDRRLQGIPGRFHAVLDRFPLEADRA